jgi:Spy/CpxP family protein refolding chaperone
MNLSDYILLPREQRIAHIDLTTPCVLVKGHNNRAPRRNLLRQLGLIDDGVARTVHCCHLCPNNSAAKERCANPNHLYMGTSSENQHDIPVAQRIAISKKAQAARSPLTNEQRLARGQTVRKMWEDKSAEDRSAIAKQRAENIRQNNSYTTEQRSTAAKKSKAALTPEQRSEITRKAWETRRRNQQGG